MGLRRDHRRRGFSNATQGSSGGWQLVYTGFVLIMLCFFIMLTSFASLQQSKIAQFAKSFSSAVTVFSAGRALEPGETMIDSEALMIDKQNQLIRLFDKVSMLGEDKGLEQVEIHRDQRGVIMTLADTMLFTSGNAAFSESAYPLLAKISSIIKSVDVPVEIEGHTDDIPIYTAAYPSNWELSTARAVNVLRYMIERQNVNKNLLSAVGKSKYHPIVANRSLENRKKNRRVEIIFKPEQVD